MPASPALGQEWDKTFALSERVQHYKTTFHTRYGFTLSADVYSPQERGAGALPGIAVCGPFGAVKEQASGLYAMTLAERGFVAVAFDPSFTGESSGEPRYVASPDINTEDFCAAVDFLSALEGVDTARIGILGICGWGSLAVNAAAQDTRIKATVTSTMYDIFRVTARGYFDSLDAEGRQQLRRKLNAQRTADYKSGSYARPEKSIDISAPDTPWFVRDYHDYYCTPRGYHPRSLNSNRGWNLTSPLSVMNMPVMQWAEEIRSAVLLVHGEKAHSRYFSEDTYKRLRGDNKRLLIVPGAVHTDLYDRRDLIPFDQIVQFYNEMLK